MHAQSIRLSSKPVFYGAAILLFIVAVLNCLTPLRLNTDGVRYFNIMLYLQGKLPADDYAGRDFFPHGYPLLLKGLAAINLLNAKILVLINLAAIVCAGYFISKTYAVKQWLVLTVLLLLSFINVKHFTLPLADTLFCGVFVLTIHCWTKALTTKRVFIVPALFLAVVSLYLRTAGLVIIAGLALYAVVANLSWIKLKTYRIVLLTIAVISAVAIFFIKLPALESKNDYFRQLAIDGIVKQPLSLFNRLGIHFKELGEFVINLPASKLTAIAHLNARVVDAALIIIGLIAIVTLLFLFVKWRLYKQVGGCIFLCYLLMIFIWPFYDGRFLIPAIPFFIYMLRRLYLTNKHWIFKGIAGVYIVMGLASLGYSTAMSLDRGLFLKYYGNDPQLSASYLKHFNGSHPTPDILQDRILYLLDNFDK